MRGGCRARSVYVRVGSFAQIVGLTLLVQSKKIKSNSLKIAEIKLRLDLEIVSSPEMFKSINIKNMFSIAQHNEGCPKSPRCT